MTSFPVDSGQRWEQVRSYLTGALPSSEVTSEPLVPGQAPVIFMWMTQLMAGFAYSNGDTELSYKKLFGSFKNYYAVNRKRLDALELSFVFCVQPGLPDLERFSSEVETDASFCRKFVVPLATSLDRAFERLPFLPLALGPGGLQRPPSARTYMGQLGVPATLARYLAVPHQRGPENIVKDCLDESSTWTPVLASQRPPTMSAVEAQQEEEETVRLDAVAIQSFRAYKRGQVFDLGRAVTVLYGPNGFGKTSFFDAMDFVATGGVGRLDLSPTTERFAKAVAHLDGKREEGSVGLHFSANGVARKVSRRITTRAHASLDGADCDRKRALLEITGSGSEGTDRIDHLVRLFRATHFFSQGRPELGKGFDRDCVLPPDVVAHMLAFDDYANARSKASEVCAVLQQALGLATGGVGELKRQIEEAETVIGRLDHVAEEYGRSAAPAEALRMLERRVREAGLAVQIAEEGDRVFVRACRAAIQAALGEGKARVGRLTALAEGVRALPGVEDGLEALAKRRQRAEAEFRKVEEAVGSAEARAWEASARLQKLEAERGRERARVEALQWVRETQPRYRELLKLEGKAVKAIETGNEILGRLRERRLLAVQELRDKEQAAEGCAWRLAKARGEVTELRRLADGAETWRADVVWVGEARAREDKLSTALEGLRGEEGTLASRLARSRTSEARLDKQIAAVERERSDFSALLGRVEGYIRDARCPLCGHDHGSAEALRKQVGEQRSQDAAAELRERVIALKEAGKELAHRLAELREDAALQSSQGEELRERRRTREARIATVEEAIEQIDIAAKEPNLVIVEIGERWAHARGNAERLEGRGAVLRREVKSHSAMTGDLDREIEHEERAVVEMERELAEYRRRLGQLRGDRRALEVSLDADAATLQEGVDRASDELSKADVAVAEESGVAKESTEAVNALRRRATTLATTLDGLKKEIGARGITLREVNAQLREFGFAAGVETAEVVRLLEAETKTNGRLAELRDFADSVEVAMDTATTTATLRQHRWAVRDRQRRIEETEREIERHESWRSYFAAVGEKLAEKQNAAVARFADEYGPTASAIQERLRSVYGFEGIDTRSHESTIRVRVKRGSEVLRPTDYFSDSQQRTLLLGLFLTASISQSWSHLTTVLLDDPVMHFDDVNTYAFLDMIAGFLNARSGPRQFIVSTCDRKVLQLARNRFRHLGRDARFYEFAAIGRDGPVVEEIPAG